MRHWKITTVFLVVLVLAVCLPVAACNNSGGSGGSSVEQEDCDAGDLAEGDEDCYGIDIDRHKPKAKKTSGVTQRQPTVQQRRSTSTKSRH